MLHTKFIHCSATYTICFFLSINGTHSCLLLSINGSHVRLKELRPLVYPLTQVLLGTVRLVPTPRYFPLRLRCIRALLGLGKAVGQFIPLSPLLLEILQVRAT